MEEHLQARFIINTLHHAGFVAYYAGGWVRDFLLKHPSDDIDIATNASPETVQQLFPRTVPIGIAFGIILVIIDPEHQYEVATFRQDLDYQDGRRPNRVEFTTAEEDAKRRDFTINGMFYDPIHQTVLDYVGGQEDLKKQIIRAIGNPHERIKEDRLRMIRAIRLACRFGFHIESETQQAIRAHAKELFPAVAIERIVQEFEKGLAFGSLYKMLIMLNDFGLLSSIFPELIHLDHSEAVQRLSPLLRYPKSSPLIAHLLPLFPSFLLDEQLQLCKKLKLSNHDQQWVCYFHALKKAVEDDFNQTRLIENVEWAYLYANPFYPASIQIIAARFEKKTAQTLSLTHEKRMHALKPAIECIVQKKPVVSSSDLLKSGIQPGKQMGVLLKEAERIAFNEHIYDPPSVIEKLQQLPDWRAK